jgi:hypothetical protein
MKLDEPSYALRALSSIPPKQRSVAVHMALGSLYMWVHDTCCVGRSPLNLIGPAVVLHAPRTLTRIRRKLGLIKEAMNSYKSAVKLNPLALEAIVALAQLGRCVRQSLTLGRQSV